MRSRRLTSLPNFEQAHHEFDLNLRRYNTHALGRNALSENAKASMRQDSAMSLKATNAWSRVAYAHAVKRELRRYFQNSGGRLNDIFFVTVTPAKWSLSFDRSFPDLSRHRLELTNLLNTANSFGLFDIAYYGNLNLTGTTTTSSLSLHSHKLVWGITEPEMMELKRIYNASTPALIRNRPAFDFMKDTMERAAEHMVYLSKAPLREYRRDQRRFDRVRSSDGADLRKLAGPWKRDLRKRDAARMSNLLADTTIPQLTIATGDGEKYGKE